MANVKKITIYDAQGNPTTYNVKDNVSGYEVATNKATSLENADNITYPTTKAVADALLVYVPTINVTSETEATITCTNGSVTYSEYGNNVNFRVAIGEWTISNGVTSKTITLTEVKTYFVELINCFGIQRRISNTSPAWERTDASVGMTATASVGSTAGHSDFDDKYPYSEIERVTIGSDVMVKIPKFYYSRTQDGTYEYIKIRGTSASGFKLHPAFDRPDGVRDYIYVGAYKTSSNNKSVSGASPQASQTRSTFRTNAKAKGTGWGIIDFSTLSAIQMLMMVEFATNDMQTAIGAGFTSSSHSTYNMTGSCDSVPNLTGRPSGTSNDVDVVWRGIEGFWGNVYEWTDGLNVNGKQYYICNNPANYADDTSTNYELLSYTAPSSGYISKMGYDTTYDYAMMPIQASGSSSTYYTDYVYASDSGWRVLGHGGSWGSDLGAGLFYVDVDRSSSHASTGNGSRLLYI